MPMLKSGTKSAKTRSKSASSSKKRSGKKGKRNSYDYKKVDNELEVSMLVSLSITRQQRSWGSICIPSYIGPIVIEDMKIRRDDDGDLRSSLPFKIVPNKDEGGTGKTCSSCSSYYVAGKGKVKTGIRGEGAMLASRMFFEAYKQCSTCKNMRPMYPDVIERLQKTIKKLSKELKNEELDKDEADKLLLRLDRASKELDRQNARCFANSNRVWTQADDKDQSVNIRCSEYTKVKAKKSKKGGEPKDSKTTLDMKAAFAAEFVTDEEEGQKS